MTSGLSLSARDTVDTDTPASRAMSAICTGEARPGAAPAVGLAVPAAVVAGGAPAALASAAAGFCAAVELDLRAMDQGWRVLGLVGRPSNLRLGSFA